MNVTCPSCATIYRVDPAKVPEAGVRARCKVCAAIFPVTKTPAAAPSAAPPAAEATVKRPAVEPFAPGVDSEVTVKRPAVVPKPPPVEEPTVRRPAFSMEPDRPHPEALDTTAPRSQVELESTAPRPATAAEVEQAQTAGELEATAKRTAMPPDLDETARRPQVEPTAGSGLPPRPGIPPLPPPVAARPAAPPPAVPTAGRPTAPRQFPPPAGVPARPPVMPPPAMRATTAPAAPPPLVPPTPPKPPAPAPAAPLAAAPAAPAAPRPAGGRPVNPFLSQDPSQKARRLARALISDLAVYYPDRRKEGLAQGTLKQLFQEEIQKSWEEFTEQVGKEVAESTTYFNDALNEILAGGQKVF